jgi:hypothetical protein
MAISKLNPVSSSPTPVGAGSLVYKGLAKSGTYLANLSAGSYIIRCNGYGSGNNQNGFYINNSYSYTGKPVNNTGKIRWNQPAYITLSASDTALGITSDLDALRLPTFTVVNNNQMAIMSNGSTDMVIIGKDNTTWYSIKSTDSATTFGATAQPGTTTTLGSSIAYFGYVNSNYIAGFSNGYITRSTNGTSWTNNLIGGANDVSGVAFGNSIYVATKRVSSGTTSLYSSTDLATWTSRTNPVTTSNVNGVAFGNGTFVAVLDSGNVVTSTNGTSWTQVTISGISGALYSIAYVNGRFIAAGTNKIVSSTDGSTWSVALTTLAYQPSYQANFTYTNPITYTDGMYFVNDARNRFSYQFGMWVSSDATTWTRVPLQFLDSSWLSGSSTPPDNVLTTRSLGEYGITSVDDTVYGGIFEGSSGYVFLGRTRPMYVEIYNLA